jgi:hypothetical protein
MRRTHRRSGAEAGADSPVEDIAAEGNRPAVGPVGIHHHSSRLGGKPVEAPVETHE